MATTSEEQQWRMTTAAVVDRMTKQMPHWKPTAASSGSGSGSGVGVGGSARSTTSNASTHSVETLFTAASQRLKLAKCVPGGEGVRAHQPRRATHMWHLLDAEAQEEIRNAEPRTAAEIAVLKPTICPSCRSVGPKHRTYLQGALLCRGCGNRFSASMIDPFEGDRVWMGGDGLGVRRHELQGVQCAVDQKSWAIGGHGFGDGSEAHHAAAKLAIGVAGTAGRAIDPEFVRMWKEMPIPQHVERGDRRSAAWHRQQQIQRAKEAKILSAIEFARSAEAARAAAAVHTSPTKAAAAAVVGATKHDRMDDAEEEEEEEEGGHPPAAKRSRLETEEGAGERGRIWSPTRVRVRGPRRRRKNKGKNVLPQNELEQRERYATALRRVYFNALKHVMSHLERVHGHDVSAGMKVVANAYAVAMFNKSNYAEGTTSPYTSRRYDVVAAVCLYFALRLFRGELIEEEALERAMELVGVDAVRHASAVTHLKAGLESRAADDIEGDVFAQRLRELRCNANFVRRDMETLIKRACPQFVDLWTTGIGVLESSIRGDDGAEAAAIDTAYLGIIARILDGDARGNAAACLTALVRASMGHLPREMTHPHTKKGKDEQRWRLVPLLMKKVPTVVGALTVALLEDGFGEHATAAAVVRKRAYDLFWDKLRKTAPHRRKPTACAAFRTEICRVVASTLHVMPNTLEQAVEALTTAGAMPFTGRSAGVSKPLGNAIRLGGGGDLPPSFSVEVGAAAAAKSTFQTSAAVATSPFCSPAEENGLLEFDA